MTKEGEKKDLRSAEIITRATAEFLAKNSNRTSLVTVTKTEILDKGKKAYIFISIFPDDKTDKALEFAKRKRTELRDYLKQNTNLPIIPFIDILIDRGELNRQKIDSLSLEAK